MIEMQATGLRAAFEESGYLGPIRIFSPEECAPLLSLLRAAPRPADWFKGHAVTSRAFYSVGSDPRIVDRVAELIGGDVLLWGASLVRKAPGRIHPWHTDIETSEDLPGTVSVWIGLENTSVRSSLQLVARSHRLGMTIQHRAARAGRARGEAAPEQLLSWAREGEPLSELVRPDMGDGEAIFFDGRLWHGSENTNTAGTRTALLLQYAAPDRLIRVPDLRHLMPPFVFLEEPLPPCVLVRGERRWTRNRIVRAPSKRPAVNWVHALDLPLPLPVDDSGWGPRRMFAGATPTMRSLAVHASVLLPGASPHPPKGHDEEELVVVLDGEPDLEMLDASGTSIRRTTGRGTILYCADGTPHTMYNQSVSPASYLILKWENGSAWKGARAEGTLASGFFLPPEVGPDHERRRATALVFQGPTRHLRRLHCHRTALAPGGGIASHADPYDVAIVVLEGTVETCGRRLGPNAVVFYAAGNLHEIRNPGESVASYLVFEFHGAARHRPLIRQLAARTPRRLRNSLPRPLRSGLRRLLDLVAD